VCENQICPSLQPLTFELAFLCRSLAMTEAGKKRSRWGADVPIGSVDGTIPAGSAAAVAANVLAAAEVAKIRALELARRFSGGAGASGSGVATGSNDSKLYIVHCVPVPSIETDTVWVVASTNE
jgi:hypothetical protein